MTTTNPPIRPTKKRKTSQSPEPTKSSPASPSSSSSSSSSFDNPLPDELPSDAYDSPSPDELSSDESSSSLPNPQKSKKRKRHNPTLFATSMTKILTSHLTTTLRTDPILARSNKQPSHTPSATSLLESKAKRILTAQKKKDLEKGRIRNIIPIVGQEIESPPSTTPSITTIPASPAVKKLTSESDIRRTLEKEKSLRKTAQRGVVKLFNAVRQAQIQVELASKQAQASGLVGRGNVEQKVTELSKQGFLDLIKSSG